MTAPLRLRDAGVAELAALGDLALRSKAHWGYGPDMLAAMTAELAWDASDLRSMRMRVAERSGERLGFSIVAPLDADRVELEALFVEPWVIGMGIGRRLMEDAVEGARGLGARRMLIQADPFAERFYLAGGARRIGERASGSIPGRMLPLLELDLVPGPHPSDA